MLEMDIAIMHVTQIEAVKEEATVVGIAIRFVLALDPAALEVEAVAPLEAAKVTVTADTIARAMEDVR